MNKNGFELMCEEVQIDIENSHNHHYSGATNCNYTAISEEVLKFDVNTPRDT